MPDLPVNIDTTYPDNTVDPSVADHQQDHDALHALHNAIAGATPDLESLGIQAHSAVLDATTASFTTTDETKLDGIETEATADQTPAELLTAVKTVDGTGSGLDADLLDGNEATAFEVAGAVTDHESNPDPHTDYQLVGDMANYQLVSGKGAANGYASLDGSTKIPIAQVPTASTMGCVVHGATAGTARPSGFAAVMWIGSVEPTNATNNDIWMNTT